MSQSTQSGDVTAPGGAPALSRLARAERITTIVAVVLAAAAAIFLYVTLFSEHEVCYGLGANHLLCQPLDATAVARATVVWGYLGVLFAATAFGAWWHAGAVERSAQSAAFGLTATSWLVLIGIIVPSISGAGLYLLPAGIAITAAAVIATVKFFQDLRASRAAGNQPY
jgi:hypothetical protein